MSIAWANNPNGVCEDAPCCGCCGPTGDGAFDPEERGYEDALDAEAAFYEDGEPEFDDDEDGDGEFYWEPSPDPCWMND